MGNDDNPSSSAFYSLEKGHEDVKDGRREAVAVVKARVRSQGVSKKRKGQAPKMIYKKSEWIKKGL